MSRKRRWLFAVALWAVVPGPGSSPPAYASAKLEAFRYARSISCPSDGEGIWRVSLDAPVYNAARPDFADLRVTSEGGAEIAFVVRLETGAEQVTSLSPAIRNREFEPGKSSSAVLDFGGKVMKNSVRIVTPGKNFRRKVRVEASEDGAHWQVLREDAFLFQVEEGEGGRPFRKEEVELPSGDQRYLRVRVLNDESDPAKVQIEAVTASMIRKTAAMLEPVPVSVLSTREDREGRCTELILDTGARGRVLDSLHLAFNDANFHRTVTVEGRDAEAETAEIPLEDGGVRRARREVPWRWVASGTLRRISTAGPAESGQEVRMGREGFRFLRVRIYNGDDPPLKLREIRAEGVVRSLLFAGAAGKQYRLYYGDPHAAQPRYDLAHFLPRLEEAHVSAASLGGEEPNSQYRTDRSTGPGKRTRRLLLWGALALVMAVLAWLIRSARASRRIEA